MVSNTSIKWQGVPEILAILCRLQHPDDYHLLLRNVLVPLHKAPHLNALHEELMQCCTQSW